MLSDSESDVEDVTQATTKRRKIDHKADEEVRAFVQTMNTPKEVTTRSKAKST